MRNYKVRLLCKIVNGKKIYLNKWNNNWMRKKIKLMKFYKKLTNFNNKKKS